MCESLLVTVRASVRQLKDPAGGGGAGDQVELVGLGIAVEQPGALARHVGEHAHLEFVDQVEPYERPEQADTTPNDDVAGTTDNSELGQLSSARATHCETAPAVLVGRDWLTARGRGRMTA